MLSAPAAGSIPASGSRTAKATLLVDCGASSLVALKARGLDHDRDRRHRAVASAWRSFRRLAVPVARCAVSQPARAAAADRRAAGHARAARAVLEVFFPRLDRQQMAVCLAVMEIEPGSRPNVLGHTVTTTEVVHPSGAPSTAVRISDGEKDVRLFRRHRMDRGAGRRCRRRRSLHRRMLRLCRQADRPPDLGGPQSRGCPICARGGS